MQIGIFLYTWNVIQGVIFFACSSHTRPENSIVQGLLLNFPLPIRVSWDQTTFVEFIRRLYPGIDSGGNSAMTLGKRFIWELEKMYFFYEYELRSLISRVRRSRKFLLMGLIVHINSPVRSGVVYGIYTSQTKMHDDWKFCSVQEVVTERMRNRYIDAPRFAFYHFFESCSSKMLSLSRQRLSANFFTARFFVKLHSGLCIRTLRSIQALEVVLEENSANSILASYTPVSVDNSKPKCQYSRRNSCNRIVVSIDIWKDEAKVDVLLSKIGEWIRDIEYEYVWKAIVLSAMLRKLTAIPGFIRSGSSMQWVAVFVAASLRIVERGLESSDASLFDKCFLAFIYIESISRTIKAELRKPPSGSAEQVVWIRYLGGKLDFLEIYRKYLAELNEMGSYAYRELYATACGFLRQNRWNDPLCNVELENIYTYMDSSRLI